MNTHWSPAGDDLRRADTDRLCTALSTGGGTSRVRNASSERVIGTRHRNASSDGQRRQQRASIGRPTDVIKDVKQPDKNSSDGALTGGLSELRRKKGRWCLGLSAAGPQLLEQRLVVFTNRTATRPLLMALHDRLQAVSNGPFMSVVCALLSVLLTRWH